MASIPLPALSVKTPEQPDILANYTRLQQLRNLQQETALRQQLAPLQVQQAQQGIQAAQLENQQRQQALKDQQAMTSAMQQWDGKDVNQLVPLVIKNGASATAVMGLKSKVLEQQQAYSKIAADDATTGSKNVETLKAKGDLINGAMAPLVDPKQVPDAQLPQALQSTVQDLAQKGLLDQQHAQAADALIQSGDPNAIRNGVDQFRKTFMAQSQLLDQAQKQVQIRESASTAAKNELEVQQGGPLTDQNQFINNYLKTKGLENTPANRLAGQREYIRETKIAPAEVRIQGMMQMPQAVADPNNPGGTVYVTRKDAIGQEAPNSGDVKAVQATQKYFTSGKGAQQLTAFNTAVNHLDLLDKLSGDLNNGNLQVVNRAKQAWADQTGNPAPANFAAAKNAMSGEVAAALKASGATDQEISEVGSTFSRAQSPAQLQGAINTYKTLLRSKVNNLQMQYQQGMQGKPNFGDGNPTSSTDPFAQFGGKAH